MEARESAFLGKHSMTTIITSPLLNRCILLLCLLSPTTAGVAQEVSTGDGRPEEGIGAHSVLAAQPDLDDWVTKWLRAVDKARSEEPNFRSPLVTVGVVLVQQYRYDASGQTNSDGSRTNNYGNGRGLNIIPNSRLEILVAPPPYIVHSDKSEDGNGDVSMFVRFRVFSAPKGRGNYFVGLFEGATFPSASALNGAEHTVLSPGLSLGKGWGPVNIQNTLAGTLPTSGTQVLGRSLIWNTAFQYDIKGKICPMIEQNSTFFLDGPYSGKKQTFLTPGVVFGTFRIARRLGVSVGGGEQIAVTPFHTYDHRWISSIRFPF
jgi:hypothetical protein